jgi:peptidoglycan/LPS O-acetylase OafA/YrhL
MPDLATESLSENSSLSLDLLRAASAQIVVIGHGISFMGILLWLQEPPVGNFPLIQNIGVVFFFILSGFVITYTTLHKINKKSYNFKTFFVERFSRIYSGYAPALIIIAVLDCILLFYLGGSLQYNSYNPQTFIGNIFMLQDNPLLNGPPILLHFTSSVVLTSFGSARQLWTLGVEWWIYMFFGWLFLGLVTIKNRVIFAVILIILLIPPLYYALPSSRGGGLAIMWAMGATAALILNYRFKFKSGLRKISPFATVILFTLAAVRTYTIKNAYDLLFALMLTGGIFFLVTYLDSSRFVLPQRIKKVIHTTSGYSMTLYLLHYSVFVILTTFIATYSPYLLFIIGFVLSNVISFSLAHFTEMRYRDLRKYLFAKLNLS